MEMAKFGEIFVSSTCNKRRDYIITVNLSNCNTPSGYSYLPARLIEVTCYYHTFIRPLNRYEA